MLGLVPLGDRAFLARFSRDVEAQRWARDVRSRAITGVVDVAVAYDSAAVHLDPDRVDPIDLERTLRSIVPAAARGPIGRLIVVPVLYDGEDLGEVSAAVGLTELEVIERHGSVDYVVFALGFQPGFPYAGDLPAALSGMARRGTPRLKVPAGSVAIAGRQTGIYPQGSPGGWRLLGRTPLAIVDLARASFPIRPGDRLRFDPIDEGTFRAMLGEPIGLAK